MTRLPDNVKACVPRGYLPRKDVKGEICLITGAGSGIGRLMAIEFAKLGCTMVLWDVNTAGNEETKSMLGKTGVSVHVYTVDLSKREEINATAKRVLKEVGTVDILINNAGVVTGKTLAEMSDESIERSMAVNASACIYTAKNFVKPMIEKNHGHIVTIASIAGKIGGPRVVDYCASKFAAVGFHESLAAELQHLKSEGVKMTLVCPYFINTGMFAGAENKSQRFAPILEPDFAVECIMEAVLTNQAELVMPKSVYAFLAIVQLLPTEAKHIVCEYFGQYESMDNFIGRTSSA